jgi:hypothetical protein
LDNQLRVERFERQLEIDALNQRNFAETITSQQMFQCFMDRIQSLESQIAQQQTQIAQQQTQQQTQIAQQQKQMAKQQKENMIKYEKLNVKVATLEIKFNHVDQANSQTQKELYRLQKNVDSLGTSFEKTLRSFDILSGGVLMETQGLKSALQVTKPKNRSLNSGETDESTASGIQNWSMSKSRETNRSLQETTTAYKRKLNQRIALFAA